MAEPAVYKAQEVADLLRINIRTLYRMVAAGKIPIVRIGVADEFRVSREVVDALLKGDDLTKLEQEDA